MMLTEAEARDRWCHTPEFDKCRASACMAWRWERPTGTERAARALAERFGEPLEELPVTERRGYCGLAGVPPLCWRGVHRTEGEDDE
jgi:hypothetical protein